MAADKRPRRRLTREQIVAAALALADEGGLEQLSMRSLAVQIKSDPTAVYRHFRDKQELLLAMVDLALSELVFPVGTGDWRRIARELAVRLRGVLNAHPGITMLLATGQPTPGTVNATIRAMSLLQAAGLPAEAAVRMQRSVVSYIVGWVLIERGLGAGQRESNFASALRLATGYQQADAAAVAGAVAPDRSAPGEFEFGLDLLLDGLGAALADILTGPAST